MEIKYLTTEEIVAIHDEIIKSSGGHTGMINMSNLDFVVSQVEIPKDLVRKAATLFFGILTSHPFVDGNKRTAFESMKTFLYLNDKEFSSEEGDAWNKLHEISEGKLKFQEVLNWIKENVK